MPLMKTANPALNDKTFRPAGAIYGGFSGAAERMTLSGTVNKTGVLLLLRRRLRLLDLVPLPQHATTSPRSARS